jgi:hypothetical protein
VKQFDGMQNMRILIPSLSLVNNSNVQGYTSAAWTNITLSITSTGIDHNRLIYLYTSGSFSEVGAGRLMRCTNSTDVLWKADARL